MRSVLLLIFVVFLVFLEDCSSYKLHEVKHSKLVRYRRENVKILKSGHLPDGTVYEKIEESGNELPPLPIEEDTEYAKENILGKYNEREEILVPVDSHGNVLPEFEYLLKPIVIEINADKLGKIAENAKVLHIPKNAADSELTKTFEDRTSGRFVGGEGEDGETAGEDYGEEDETARAEIPELPAVDYNDSGESDENLKPENENEIVGEGGDKDKEIEIPSNRNDDSVAPIDIDYSKNDEGKDVQIPPNVLVPDRGELGEAIPFLPQPEREEDKESRKDNNVDETDSLTEEDIRELADGFRKEVYEGIVDKASDGLFDETDEKQIAEDSYDPYANLQLDKNGIKSIDGEKDSKKPDGYILEDAELTEEEKEQIKNEHEGKNKKNPSVSTAGETAKEGTVVRGGRVGPIPDAATSSSINYLIITASLLILAF